MKKNKRLVEYTLGFLLFSLGQVWLQQRWMIPLIESRSPAPTIGLLGVFLIGLGGFFLLRSFLVLWKKVGASRVRQALLIGLGLLLGLAVLGGLLSSILYGLTPMSYQEVKVVVWCLSAYGQSLLRTGLLYYLLCLYQERPCQWQSQETRQLILVVCGLVTCSIFFRLSLSNVGSLAQWLVDTALTVGLPYVLLSRKS